MKKHSFEKLLRVLVVLVLVYDMIHALAALMMWKVRRLEQSKQGKRHKRYLSFILSMSLMFTSLFTGVVFAEEKAADSLESYIAQFEENPVTT